MYSSGHQDPGTDTSNELYNDPAYAPNYPYVAYPNQTAFYVEVEPELCPICFDPITRDQLVYLQPCQHPFCKPCIRTFVTRLAKENDRYPIPCPQCETPVDDSLCLSLVNGLEDIEFKLNRMIIEKNICSHLRYCSNEKCGEPFDWVQDPLLAGAPDEFRVECPLCQVVTCVKCRDRWHEGKTCEQNIKDGDEQNNVLAIGKELGWTRCPNCNNMVDRRRGDCFFVRCRCGCGFCHNCGTPYRSLEATAGNQHGVPDCNCGLFGEHIEPAADPARVRIVEGLRELQVRMERIIARPLPANDHDWDDIANGQEGPNGYVVLADWLGSRRQRRKLAPQMLADLREFRCPYPVCKQQFGSLRGLEQHLVSVQRHEVFLCCGRPFYSERSRERHRRAVHNMQGL